MSLNWAGWVCRQITLCIETLLDGANLSRKATENDKNGGYGENFAFLAPWEQKLPLFGALRHRELGHVRTKIKIFSPKTSGQNLANWPRSGPSLQRDYQGSYRAAQLKDRSHRRELLSGFPRGCLLHSVLSMGFIDATAGWQIYLVLDLTRRHDATSQTAPLPLTAALSSGVLDCGQEIRYSRGLADVHPYHDNFKSFFENQHPKAADSEEQHRAFESIHWKT
ncbi:hypothetical protein R3P38DRAFT_2788551 [Favolaschia claudopus]|uniref:Uncharacterized protein n=1 Tax=Favolaschia claudopus TaxID=2862362 RepID=A0AAW0AJE6_9AGAR